jgi:hypothetical protein
MQFRLQDLKACEQSYEQALYFRKDVSKNSDIHEILVP